LFPPDQGVLLQLGVGKRLRVLTKRFELSLSAQGIDLIRQDRKSSDILGSAETFRFPFNRIQSMIVNVKSTVELYMDDTLYRVRIHKRSSILKYFESYQAIKARELSAQAKVGT
jgi:1-acyl-sn-glycerol-3-phosphate acyltransferase